MNNNKKNTQQSTLQQKANSAIKEIKKDNYQMGQDGNVQKSNEPHVDPYVKARENLTTILGVESLTNLDKVIKTKFAEQDSKTRNNSVDKLKEQAIINFSNNLISGIPKEAKEIQNYAARYAKETIIQGGNGKGQSNMFESGNSMLNVTERHFGKQAAFVEAQAREKERAAEQRRLENERKAQAVAAKAESDRIAAETSKQQQEQAAKLEADRKAQEKNNNMDALDQNGNLSRFNTGNDNFFVEQEEQEERGKGNEFDDDIENILNETEEGSVNKDIQGIESQNHNNPLAQQLQNGGLDAEKLLGNINNIEELLDKAETEISNNNKINNVEINPQEMEVAQDVNQNQEQNFNALNDHQTNQQVEENIETDYEDTLTQSQISAKEVDDLINSIGDSPQQNQENNTLNTQQPKGDQNKDIGDGVDELITAAEAEIKRNQQATPSFQQETQKNENIPKVDGEETFVNQFVDDIANIADDQGVNNRNQEQQNPQQPSGLGGLDHGIDTKSKRDAQQKGQQEQEENYKDDFEPETPEEKMQNDTTYGSINYDTSLLFKSEEVDNVPETVNKSETQSINNNTGLLDGKPEAMNIPEVGKENETQLSGLGGLDHAMRLAGERDAKQPKAQSQDEIDAARSRRPGDGFDTQGEAGDLSDINDFDDDSIPNFDNIKEYNDDLSADSDGVENLENEPGSSYIPEKSITPMKNEENFDGIEEQDDLNTGGDEVESDGKKIEEDINIPDEGEEQNPSPKNQPQDGNKENDKQNGEQKGGVLNMDLSQNSGGNQSRQGALPGKSQGGDEQSSGGKQGEGDKKGGGVFGDQNQSEIAKKVKAIEAKAKEVEDAKKKEQEAKGQKGGASQSGGSNKHKSGSEQQDGNNTQGGSTDQPNERTGDEELSAKIKRLEKELEDLKNEFKKLQQNEKEAGGQSKESQNATKKAKKQDNFNDITEASEFKYDKDYKLELELPEEELDNSDVETQAGDFNHRTIQDDFDIADRVYGRKKEDLEMNENKYQRDDYAIGEEREDVPQNDTQKMAQQQEKTKEQDSKARNDAEQKHDQTMSLDPQGTKQASNIKDGDKKPEAQSNWRKDIKLDGGKGTDKDTDKIRGQERGKPTNIKDFRDAVNSSNKKFDEMLRGNKIDLGKGTKSVTGGGTPNIPSMQHISETLKR